MRLIIYCIAYLVICSLHSFATDDDLYKISTIPLELKKNAAAVVRKEQKILHINSMNEAELEVKYAISILNENAHDLSLLQLPYDRTSRIKNIKGNIYGEDGKRIRKMDSDYFYDYSNISGFSVFEDNRVKIGNPKHKTYPFTVEYSYTIVYSQTLFLPSYVPVPAYNVSVEHSEFLLVLPLADTFKYCQRQFFNNPVYASNDTRKTFAWRLEQYPARKREDYLESVRESFPYVSIGLQDFQIEGTKGNTASWQSFGNWAYSLIQGRQQLPEATVTKIRDMVAVASSARDKVRILYQYLQDKVRYVSIQEGLGSWMPMEAELVDKVSYGDCKGLSNYMKALLSAADIPSDYVLIRAGEDENSFNTEFVSSQFNHAILRVPLPNDTIWLECTSNQNPMGYLGRFTDDRYALAVGENGRSHLVHTPVYGADVNIKSSKAEIRLDINGSSTLDASISCSGVFYDDYSELFRSNTESQKKMLASIFHLDNTQLQEYTKEENKDRIPSVKLTAKLSVAHIGTKMSDRWLLPLLVYHKTNHGLKEREDRQHDIFIRRATQLSDTTVYIIPEDYSVGKPFEPVTITSEFGTYKMEVQLIDNKLYVIRKRVINKGKFSKEKYPAFVKFWSDMKKQDNSSIILMKKA